ncbi:MAG TPA: outer membrane protein assembly factor BamD [Pseudomonadales bacterium]
MQRQLILLIMSCVFLASCASNQNRYDYMSEEQLYQEARQNMIARKFNRAQEAYQALETRFPFGQYAEQAQLEAVSAYYQSMEYERAVAAADRFIRLHPDHPEVDHAYYYKGLANFDANRSLIDRFFSIDLSKRDPGAARNAYNDFATLVSLYPESRFAADASARMTHLRNLLARHEVHVANYYFKRGAYTAAANRGKFVVEHYQGTPAVSDGLAIMAQAYKLLDMPGLAEDSINVLRRNYPDHESLDNNGNFIDKFSLEAAEQSRLSKATLGIMGQQEPPEFDNRN